MKNDKFLYFIKISILALFIFFTLIFIVIIPISYIYILGWISGAILSVATYFINIWLNSKIITINKSKRRIFWIVFLKFYVIFILQILFVVAIIAINVNANNGVLFYTRGIRLLFGPINIFTFIFGCSLCMIATFFSIIFFKINARRNTKLVGGLKV